MIRLTNALGAEKILPRTIILGRIPFDVNIPLQHLYGLDGGVRTGKETILPRRFSLAGRIYYPGDKERIRQEFDSILSFLLHPPIEVYVGGRFLRCRLEGAPKRSIDRGAELEVQFDMIAPDPYWYGQEVEVAVSGTQTVTVDGNAPAIPFVQTVGSASSLTVSNLTNGKQIAVSGVSGVIKIDSVSREVTVDGYNELDKANDDWVLYGFELAPGSNQLSTNRAITITYRPRWL